MTHTAHEELRHQLSDYLISLRLRRKYNTRRGADELADAILRLVADEVGKLPAYNVGQSCMQNKVLDLLGGGR